jgi:hypothetical protein
MPGSRPSWHQLGLWRGTWAAALVQSQHLPLGSGACMHRYPREDSWALVNKVSAGVVWNMSANVIKDRT